MIVEDVVVLACDFVSGSSSIVFGALGSFFLARLVVFLVRNGGAV